MNKPIPQETDKIKTLIVGMFDRDISIPLIRLVTDTIVNSCLKVNPELDVSSTTKTYLHVRVTVSAAIAGEAPKNTKPANDLEEFLHYTKARTAQDFDFPIEIDRAALVKAISKSIARLQSTYNCKMNVFSTNDKGVPQLVIELNSIALNRPISVKVNV